MGPTSVQAWCLTLISLVLVIGNVFVQYGINLWNRSFFNALQQRDQSFVYQAIAIFLAPAFAAAIVAVLQLVFRMRLQILWRQWLMRRLVGQWLSEQRFYRTRRKPSGLRSRDQPQQAFFRGTPSKAMHCLAWIWESCHTVT